ncbi:MAG TPA: hypothetical protein VIC82_01910 [Candidatus Nanopelagicales bacterium]|jgi:hypothetical protein
MRTAYRVIAALIALGVVIQASSIAYAAFALSHAIDDGATINSDSTVGDAGFGVHGINGLMVIPLLAIVLFIISFFSGVPGGVKWAGYVLLATVVQVALGFASHAVPALGWLHGINALILFALAVYATRRATGPSAAAPAAPAHAAQG